MKAPLPLLPAAALALVLCVAAAAWAQAAAAQVTRAGDAIVFEGRIDAASAQRFVQLLQDPAVTRLVITSRGGLVAPALDMAAAIAARQLDLEVPVACFSSCANYLFPAARHKRLGHPQAVAWHGNMAHVLYLQQTGQGRWNARQLADARQLARREALLYARLGVDGFACWFGKIAPYEVEDFYSLSPADLAGFGIRDVVVQPGATAPPAAPEVQAISVDWRTIEAIRPSVDLSDP